MRVLLLNPPNKNNVLRDYYCSHISKGRYLWPPIDLMYLTGSLNEKNIDYSVLDCIAYRIDEFQTIKYIRSFDPDYIISLTGAASFATDIVFFRKIKNNFPNVALILTGDIIYHYCERFLEKYKEINGVIRSFADIEIADDLLKGKKSVIFGRENIQSKNIIKLYKPDYSFFINKNYYLPYINHPEFSTILASFSCPGRCFFCPFENITYKRRDLEDIYEELHELKKNGIKFLFFRDQSFIPSDPYYIKIMEKLKKLDFSYSISARITDMTDNKALYRLKESGCFLIQIGVESSDIKNLDGKITNKALVKKVFKNIRKTGIKTLAHFIVGFPDENILSILKNIYYILMIKPDFLSLNTLTPEPGTTLFKEYFPNGFNFEENAIDSSISKSTIKDKRFILQTDIHRKLLAIVFYSSPRFLYNSLFKTNLYQKRIMLKELYNSIRVKWS